VPTHQACTHTSQTQHKQRALSKALHSVKKLTLILDVARSSEIDRVRLYLHSIENLTLILDVDLVPLR